jgi:prevent-host-death family protein
MARSFDSQEALRVGDTSQMPLIHVMRSPKPAHRPHTPRTLFPVRPPTLDNYLYGLYGCIIKVAHMTKIPHKGSEEARNELPTLLEEAERGRPTIITRRGRPVAALVPLDQYRARRGQQSMLALEGAAQGLWGKNSRGKLKKLRDEWSR